jgi:4-amino-4-deoxy-L-arabinose transferase-like glycosyltransferase
MGLKDSLLLRDLDKTLAIAGVIFSIILIIYLGREIGRVIYLLTGVLALISCLLWLGDPEKSYL